jgi:hypothetical protein
MDHCSDRCQDNEQRCYRDCEKLDNYYRHP